MDEGLPGWLHGDAVRIRQILANIVSNAVKFTQEGRVELSVTRREGEAAPEGMAALRFCVTDEGIGIPLDKQNQLFGRFNQLDASYSRRFGGTGLGLAISRSLAELMGGEVGVESRFGKGSTFWVSVPLERGAPARVLLPPPDLRGTRVLVVDDNVDAATTTAAILSQLGHEVCIAHSGAEALAVAARCVPAVAILDIGLPDMDGYQLAGLLRGQRETRHTVLVAATGYGQALAILCLSEALRHVETEEAAA